MINYNRVTLWLTGQLWNEFRKRCDFHSPLDELTEYRRLYHVVSFAVAPKSAGPQLLNSFRDHMAHNAEAAAWALSQAVQRLTIDIKHEHLTAKKPRAVIDALTLFVLLYNEADLETKARAENLNASTYREDAASVVLGLDREKVRRKFEHVLRKLRREETQHAATYDAVVSHALQTHSRKAVTACMLPDFEKSSTDNALDADMLLNASIQWALKQCTRATKASPSLLGALAGALEVNLEAPANSKRRKLTAKSAEEVGIPRLRLR